MWNALLFLAFIAFIYFKFLKQSHVKPKCHHASGPAKRRHAIVIGGSIGGFATAGVLARHFEKVTVLDQGTYPNTDDYAQARSAVPQATQVHGMLVRGQLILESLFPGIRRELLEAGASVVRWFSDVYWYHKGIFPNTQNVPEPEGVLETVSCTRPFWDFHLRRRAENHPQIEIRTKHRVESIIYKEGTAVGVEYRHGDQVEELEADFIAVATGRGSNRLVRKWLKHAGVEEIEYCEVNPKLSYVTALFQPPPNTPRRIYAEYPFVKERYGYLMFPAEHDKYLILLFSYGGAEPLPTEKAQVIEKIRNNFYHPEDPIQALNEWEQLSEFRVMSDSKNEFARFDKLTNMPENLVIVGDAAATFNPSYGQGMTHAVMQADALDGTLRDHCMRFPTKDLCGVSQEYARRAAKVTRNFWDLVESEDLIKSSTEGKRTLLKRFMARFMYHAVRHFFSDPVRFVQFTRIQNGIESPACMFAPANLFPILKGVVLEAIEEWKTGSSQWHPTTTKVDFGKQPSS